MEIYFACLGLTSYLMFEAFASHVEVNGDITVKSTPYLPLSNAEMVNVSMSCRGNRSDLSYYIRNKMRWTFIASSGKELILTNSFYASEAAEALFNGPEARLTLIYGHGTKTYNFGITITGVTRADNGVYRCSLIEDGYVVESKDFKLTVVNPVEGVRIELYYANRDLISASASPVSKNSQPLKIPSGQYMVKCHSYGSNPEPVMDLFLNDRKSPVSVKTREDNSAEFESYIGRFKVTSLAIRAHNAPQALVCKVNIPGDFYQSSEAGIALMVPITKPNIICENATASVGDRYGKLECKISMQDKTDDLMCDNISWMLGQRGQRIESDRRWIDPIKEYDIIESKCEETNLGLVVILYLFTVNSKILEETFFVTYVNGENIHRHPVTFQDVTAASASSATLLSLFVYVVLVVISKQVWLF